MWTFSVVLSNWTQFQLNNNNNVHHLPQEGADQRRPGKDFGFGFGFVSSVKKEGGIQWLHNRDDEHDENNTWNGNSPQQM